MILSPEVPESHATPTSWERFWARSFDTILYLIPLLVITPAFFIGVSYLSPTAPLWVIKFLKGIELTIYWISIILAGGGWIFIEAALLSRYGTTLGKGILGLEVVKDDNSILTYWQALKRTLFVYSLGSCFGVPVLNFQAYFLSYIYLKFQRKALWDRGTLYQFQNNVINSSGYKKVIFLVIGFWTLFSIAATFLGFFVFVAIFYGYVILGRYNATENAIDKYCYESGKPKQVCDQRRKEMDKRWGLD